KVYRGDDDLVAVAEKLGDPALVDLAKELGPSAAGSEPIARRPDEPKPAQPSANVKPDKKEPPKPDPQPDTTPTGGGRAPRDQFIVDNVRKLVPGATETFYYSQAPGAYYNFTIANKNFTGAWKVETGTAIPSVGLERQGLILKSDDGRATFDVPFTGTTHIKI